mgnify:CR=1 FL=1
MLYRPRARGITVELTESEAARDPGYAVARRRDVWLVLTRTGGACAASCACTGPRRHDRPQRLDAPARGLPLCRDRRGDLHRERRPHRRRHRGIRLVSEALAIDQLFHAMVKRGASDLHLCVGTPPMIRKGRATCSRSIRRAAPVTAPEIVQLLAPIMPEKNRRNSPSGTTRDFALRDPARALPIERVRRSPRARRGLPRHPVEDPDGGTARALARSSSSCAASIEGLVLVTGPTGSGKSTTLCAMIDYVNQTRHGSHHHDRGSDRVRARRTRSA